MLDHFSEARSSRYLLPTLGVTLRSSWTLNKTISGSCFPTSTMKLRRARVEVKNVETEAAIREEEADEDDDHATLQDCLDRQKKVTARPKRLALTPLDDEDNISRGRKKVKGMKELLATDSARSGEVPCGQTNSTKPALLVASAVSGDCSLEGGKKRRVKKKRRRDVDLGKGIGEVVQSPEFQSVPVSKGRATTESSGLLIVVPKEELAEEHPFLFVSADQLLPGGSHFCLGSPEAVQPCRGRGRCEGVQTGPRTPEVPDCNTQPSEEIFLPVDGYHTCGDAESCHIACLEKVLNHLDKMSDEQLKLWYRAVIGEVFVSRNGEKVRGRLRRMIRCKVKEAIRSQGSANVSGPVWSSPAMQASGALSSPESILVAGSLTESPGSKLSTSNTDERCGEVEEAVCSGKTFSKKPLVYDSPESSRGLTFQVPSQIKSSNEASAKSFGDEPEIAVPAVQFLVTPRITRSKARVMEKSAQDDGQGLLNNPDLCQSSSGKISVTTSEDSDVVPPVPPCAELTNSTSQRPPAEVAAERGTRSRKKLAVEMVPREVSFSNVVDDGELRHVKPSRATEELKQSFVPSYQSGDYEEQDEPSQSDVVKFLSESMDRSALSEITSLEAPSSSGFDARLSEGESVLTAHGVIAAEALNSLVVSFVSHSATRPDTDCGRIVEDDVNIEGNQPKRPLEPQGEPATRVCKSDEVTAGGFKENVDSGSKIDVEECTSNISCSMACAHWEEAPLSEIEELSEICPAKSRVGFSSCDVDDGIFHAPLNQATEFRKEIPLQEARATGAAQPRTTSSNSGAVYPASSSTHILQTVLDCVLNTECRDFPLENNDVFPSQEGSAKFFSRVSYLAADCASSVQSLRSSHSGNCFQIAEGLCPDEELHRNVNVKRCRAEGEKLCSQTGSEQLSEQLCVDNVSVEKLAFETGSVQLFEEVCAEKDFCVSVAFETGSEQIFEQVSAEKVSTFWPAEGAKESTFLSTENHDMEDISESNLLSEFERTSCSGKLQMLKCDSGWSNEKEEAAGTMGTVSLPKLWKDAGDYLQDLDNAYMLVDIGRSSSSHSLRKRKHRDFFECGKSSYAPLCYCVTSRTRQRVEFISEEENLLITEKPSPEVHDSKHFKDADQVEETNDPSMSMGCQSIVDAESSEVCEEVEDPLSSQYHQQLWIDERRNDGSTLDDYPLMEKELASQDECSETFRTKFCLSPPPCLNDSFLLEPPLCDSPASTSEEDGSPDSVGKSDASIDLLACERLTQESDLEDYGESSELLASRKIESLREAESDESPPPCLPPIRLKLPSGRARLLASALSESKLKSARDWRYSEARDLDQKQRAVTATSLSPNSSDEETGDSIQERENMFESAPNDERSSQELSVLSPPSSLPLSASTSQENNSSPEDRLPSPSRSRSSKGILKTTSKCKDCVELRSQARTASDFVASQMKTFGEVAGRLTKEIQELRSILEIELSGADGSQEGVMHDKVQAISRSRDIERSAEKNLSLLLRDCKRFCKLTAKRPRRIVFADEAGKKLCHVKTFQAPSALARPLWDIL
ncbi:hypothetical protein Mapa_009915 [Marchantia paleacea]|nr:hypothetical protein Mapa_009915 [Marchantia paleacea]